MLCKLKENIFWEEVAACPFCGALFLAHDTYQWSRWNKLIDEAMLFAKIMHHAQCCVCDLSSVHPDISGCNLTGFQCTNGGHCKESSGGSFCQCATGFTGAQCEVGKSIILARKPGLCT